MKKFIAFLLAFAIVSISVFAFNFPEPDWGALLREREGMVKETELELYVEGALDTAPYFGAKFEPKAGAYLGMVAENSHAFLPLGSYLTYFDNMNQDDIYYPANQMIKEHDAVAVIGWTISNLNVVNYEKIRQVLDTLNSYNKPMFIRFANEMNDGNMGDDPSKYIEVFRNVANMVHQYPNLATVWSPLDLGALDRPFEYYYPGDEYVDWVGISCYSKKYFLGKADTSYKDSVYFMAGDYAFASNRVKPFFDFLAKNNIKKPVMINEGGVTTNTIYGEDMESWCSPRLRNMMWYLVMKYPQIKMVNYFNTHRPDEAENFDLDNYGYAVDIFKQAANSGAYIRSAKGAPEFVFAKATEGMFLTANDGIIPLYTYAYFPNKPEVSVNYYIDGTWYHSANTIPYICNLDINSLSDGGHTLKISAEGKEKELHFIKSGSVINFGTAPLNPTVISVTVNGKPVHFDQPPVMVEDRTLVPLRAIFEALGATVEWNDPTVTANKNGINISLQIGSNEMYVNGEVKTLDVPAKLMNDRTFVPIRAVSEAFNCIVNWYDSNQYIEIIEN